MSARHGYLAFVARPLAHTLADGLEFSAQWQREMTMQNTQRYAVPAPPQVSAAFVLQHLLNVPAHLSAFAAVTGPWLVELGDLAAPRISFDLTPELYPYRVGCDTFVPFPGPREMRIAAARAAYLQVATAVVEAYEPGVKASSRQLHGMAVDLWAIALREARASVGEAPGPVVERESCCFLYALPGCHPCAGCPRLAG